MGCPRREQATVFFQNPGQEADWGHAGAWRTGSFLSPGQGPLGKGHVEFLKGGYTFVG